MSVLYASFYFLLLHIFSFHTIFSKNAVMALSSTVVRKFSIGGLCVSSGWLDILKIDRFSTDLLCFMFQFGGLSPPKTPVETRLALSEAQVIHDRTVGCNAEKLWPFKISRWESVVFMLVRLA